MKSCHLFCRNYLMSTQEDLVRLLRDEETRYQTVSHLAEKKSVDHNLYNISLALDPIRRYIGVCRPKAKRIRVYSYTPVCLV